jgi:hypothetical protein
MKKAMEKSIVHILTEAQIVAAFVSTRPTTSYARVLSLPAEQRGCRVDRFIPLFSF